MEKLIVCIADEKQKKYAQVSADRDGVTYLGGSPGFRPRVEAVLASIRTGEVFVRQELVDASDIGVDAIPVSPEDPRYAEAVAGRFVAAGFSVRIYPERQALLWRYLQTLPLSRDIQISLLPYLDAVSDTDADELVSLFGKAEQDLRALDKESRKSDGAVEALISGANEAIEKEIAKHLS